MDESYNHEDPASFLKFNTMLRAFYLQNKRPMPWRDTISPYWVVVSEVMLQQTQVPRVMEKFPTFISIFPDFSSLATASLEEVLRAWQGLGYNRRAKFLRQIAQEITGTYGGMVPDDPSILQRLPGIGAATAGSIVAFLYNYPVIFIETNIRRVFIHHFFQDRAGISDREIIPVVSRALDKDNPREWYYSMMDYGTFLAKKVPNPNRRSATYAVQSRFSGSDREVRGKILKILLDNGPISRELLIRTLQEDANRADRILDQLIGEELIIQEGPVIRFAG